MRRDLLWGGELVGVQPSSAGGGPFGLAGGAMSLPACPYLACYSALSGLCNRTCAAERCEYRVTDEGALTYWLAATRGPTTWDWDVASDGTPHPPPVPDCP